MTIKINLLEIENIKRVKAVQIKPNQNGLTIIGGKNNQGKTTILDSIVWILGGDKYKPSNFQRENSVLPPSLHLELSNGLIVERKGKNNELKIIDPEGKRAGQTLLNEFIEQLALNLPKFLQYNNKEKADILLKIIGVGEKIYKLELKEQELYNKRHTIGQIADQKLKHSMEMPYFTNVPCELISISDLLLQHNNILTQNAANQFKRNNFLKIKNELCKTEEEIKTLKMRLNTLERIKIQQENDLEISQKSVIDLNDESTLEIEENIKNIEEINIKVRANQEKIKAEKEAQEFKDQYLHLHDEINEIRQQEYNLLNTAKLPLPGLGIENLELTYQGKKWDCMSSSDQLKVATAIIKQLNPKCGFILLDKLEQMDLETLNEFGAWLEKEGLQVIATRVSTGNECNIIIEDGYIKEQGGF